MLTDALALATFALETAGVPPERIAIFAQSMGTAVAISLSQHLAVKSPPTLFAGMVLVAPFADTALLTETYRLAGTVPLLSPIAYFPRILALFHGFLRSTWPSKDTLAAMIRHCEGLYIAERLKKYDIAIIHAEDDYDIPWFHSDLVFWHAVNATIGNDASLGFEQLEAEKKKRSVSLGAGGWEVEWKGKEGIIREQIVKYGLHDRIMSYPVVSLAIARVFQQTSKL